MSAGLSTTSIADVRDRAAVPASRLRMAARAIQRFNRFCPPGTEVRIWRGLVGTGPVLVVRVLPPGARLHEGVAVVEVSDGHGTIDLVHVRRMPWAALPYTPEEDALVLQLAAEDLSDVEIARRLRARDPARRRSHAGVRDRLKQLRAAHSGVAAHRADLGVSA